MGEKMTLAGFIAGLEAAQTAEELEAAIRADFKHSFHGPTWSRICKARIAAGVRICAAHPNGRYVPVLGDRRQLSVLGQTYRVGRGQNSTGVRYAWHYAKEWAVGLIVGAGLPVRAAHRIWDSWSDYPHRCLAIVDDALAGRITDPVLGHLYPHERYEGAEPINYSVEENDNDPHGRRATRPCECGGTLFDWGAGWSEGFNFVNWHCNKCPAVFSEYMTSGRLGEIRSRERHHA